MTAPTPPTPGQPLWGDDLNAYLVSLEARIAGNEDKFVPMRDSLEALEERVDVLEDKPDYVFNSYSWQYSSATPPPTGSQVRFDNADLTAATSAVFRLTDNDGADRTAVFQNLSVGSQIRINDWDDSSILHRFNTTGPTTITASDATVPVTWVSGSGTFPNSAKANVAFIIPLSL